MNLLYDKSNTVTLNPFIDAFIEAIRGQIATIDAQIKNINTRPWLVRRQLICTNLATRLSQLRKRKLELEEELKAMTSVE